MRNEIILTPTKRKTDRKGRFFEFASVSNALGEADLLNFLLKLRKNLRHKEIRDGDLKPVAKLFERRYRHTVISPTDNIVESGLRNSRQYCKLIYKKLAIFREFLRYFL